jgi:hypothetical protein
MPKVIIWRESAIETEFDPGHRDWRIGRSETNDITLLDPRKSVSRFHAELREEGGRWVFIDLNSQNGSWNADGQRVNRLVLEHGHEVLFGDYKLAFADPPPVAAPPPVPPPMAATAEASVQTAPVIAPDQTLLMPGVKGTATPSAPSAAPPPIVRPASKPKAAPRKGINPVILILFLLTMFGAVGALAWRILTDSEPAVAEVTPAETPAPAPTPPPAQTPPPTPVTTPAATVHTPGAAVATTPGAAAGATTPGTPATGPATSGPVATGPVTTGPGAATGTATKAPATARPKRTPAAAKESSTLAAQYEEGRRAFENGRYAEAERALEAVIAQNPTFRDAPALLQRARNMQTAARERALADAQTAEAGGDWTRAISLYERAGASDEAGAARTRMHAAGDDAYRKARQFDARNRPAEAIGFYQQAVSWLAEGDARKATARERLAALKGGGA